MTYEFLETLYDDLLHIAKKIVVFRKDLAKVDETTASATAFELYYACLSGSRYFYNFAKFDIDILQKYMNDVDARACAIDANLIPERLRSDIVTDQANRVISTYVEQNGYYRMLTGLPRLDDAEWIYVTDVSGIPSDVPIHKLSSEQIARLELTGYIDALRQQYTADKYQYLGYLGVNKIELLAARLAKPFDLLRTGAPTNSYVATMFESEYYKARRYILATVYRPEIFNDKTLFYPFIGVLMVTLAMRNTLVPNEAAYLNFDEILNSILESYGLLQYFSSFPFIFKRRLVMALDSILSKKGTDGVLIDVCKLFSSDNFTANRYYLMKTNAKDINGAYIQSDDPDEKYDLNFIKADITDHELNYDSENITPYTTVINNDCLWQLTDDERRALAKEDFNLMMTKYIDIEAAYDLSEMTFEICYFLNLLLHSRDNMIKLTCSNMYSATGSSSIYTMVVFLLAGLAKRSNFDGNIIYEIPDIAEILRFNDVDITEQLNEITKKYEGQIDVNDTLLPDYTSPVGLSMPTGLVTEDQELNHFLYNRSLYNAILTEMHSTTDIRKYTALSNLKDCMFYSFMQTEDFTKSDGTQADTYMNMLEDIDPTLFAKLDSLDREEDLNELNKILLYILEKLEDTFSSDELPYLFLNTANTYGSLISKYLRTAINVFKASSVQLESINVLFYIGDHDPIRIIEQRIMHKKIGMNDRVNVSDDIAIHKHITIDDTVACIDKAYYNN